MTALMELERARGLGIQNLIYERMFNKIRECSRDFTEYKTLSEVEHVIKD